MMFTITNYLLIIYAYGAELKTFLLNTQFWFRYFQSLKRNNGAKHIGSTITALSAVVFIYMVTAIILFFKYF